MCSKSSSNTLAVQKKKEEKTKLKILKVNNEKAMEAQNKCCNMLNNKSRIREIKNLSTYAIVGPSAKITKKC